jgi:hypothetical protein
VDQPQLLKTSGLWELSFSQSTTTYSTVPANPGIKMVGLHYPLLKALTYSSGVIFFGSFPPKQVFNVSLRISLTLSSFFFSYSASSDAF